MIVRSLKACSLAAVLALAAAAPASAGGYGDELTKCLVKSTTPADQQSFVQWVFSAIALHPQVAPMANISAEQRKALDAKAAALMMRLLTVDCRKESVDALKYEGQAAIEPAFSAVGEVAMRGLMNDPAVTNGMEGFAADIDKSKLQDLYKEAGIAVK